MEKQSWVNFLPAWVGKASLAILLAAALLLAGRPLATSAGGSIWFVKPEAGGTCLSWDSACSLQTALNKAGDGDQIWIATGVYYPAITGDRNATFQIKTAVTVYGGFAGTEKTLGERDWTAHVVILNGDQNHNGPDSFDSYHVVSIGAAASLDGMMIQAGNANGTGFDGNGGGIYIYSGLQSNLVNLILLNNSAVKGGGLFNDSCNPTLTNITLKGNRASDSGGGLYNNHGSPTLTNVTFGGNSAITGGGMYNYNNSSAVVRNSILWGDSGGEIFNNNSSATVTYSDIQGGYTGVGNLNADPLFAASVPAAPTSEGDLHLRPGSPAIDAGSNSLVSPSIDLDGHLRISNGTVDMGAYEWRRIYVNAAASGANDGQSWETAYTSLAVACEAASPGDQLWLAAGSYTPGPAGNRSATFQLKTAQSVYGGFSGGETALSQRNWLAHPVILNGDLNGDDVGFTHNAENSYHVVMGVPYAASGAAPTILDGLTIRGGNTPGDSGGGLALYGGSFTLANLYITGNSASLGGGVSINDSNTSLTNVTFTGNQAATDGGGLYIGSSNGTGGNTLNAVTFSANQAEYGGGLFTSETSPTLTNVTFTGNQASQRGGGLYTLFSSPVLTHTTFNGNQAVLLGGAIHNDQGGGPIVRNSILWGDSGDEIADIPGAMVVTYSDIQGGYPGTGNLNADPLLSALGTYGGGIPTLALLPGSPAIDAAISSSCPAADARGVSRSPSSCDLGAFESQGFLISISHGTLQTARILTPFLDPLMVKVSANVSLEPVNGGKVTFAPPVSGASAVLSSSLAAIAGGIASVNATANAIHGTYIVRVSTAGANEGTFILTNANRPIFVPIIRK